MNLPPRRSLPALVVLFANATASPALAQTGQDAEQAVRDVLESVPRFTRTRDLDALGGLFATERGVHIIEGAGVNHGWEDYRDHHLAPELEAFEDLEYRFYSIEPVIRGDLAYAAFRYELDANTPAGPVSVEGRGTIVLERRAGEWKIVHMHTSGRRT